MADPITLGLSGVVGATGFAGSIVGFGEKATGVGMSAGAISKQKEAVATAAGAIPLQSAAVDVAAGAIPLQQKSIDLTRAGIDTSVEGSKIAATGALQKAAAQAKSLEAEATQQELTSQQQGYEAGIYTFQAGVARLNKQIELQNADYSRFVGEVAAQEKGMETRATVANIEASQCPTGIDVHSGTS